MNFSLPKEGMYPMLFLSLGIFIVVGFMFPASPSSRLASESQREKAVEYSASSYLREINFSSANLKDYISQGYGYTQFAAVHGGLRGNRHNGIDIAAAYGAEIHSESEGEVYYVGDQDKYCYKKAYGKFIMIKNGDDSHTLLYAHLSKINKKVGDRIKKGDVLGLVGTTGLATGSHLHFTVFNTGSLKIAEDKSCGPKPEGVDINPIKYLASRVILSK